MVDRISLGSGSPEGENSAYVLSGRRAVIDPGPPTEAAWGRLRGGIDEAGLTLGDVEYVFVTHWHADHAGLAPRLAEQADATVVMHESDAPLVADYASERARRVERDARRLREWGVPDSVVDALRAGDRPSPVPDSFPVEAVSDGDSVAGIEVIHTPGHTLGHAAFRCGEGHSGQGKDGSMHGRDALFVGDLVLPTYTPNVGGGDTRLDDALATYLGSLEQVRGLGFETACPGHGSPLTLGERIGEIVAHHDERSRRTVAALSDVASERNTADVRTATNSTDVTNPTEAAATPWDVARMLFGDLSGVHAKMGAGEAASHLEFLQTRGAVERLEETESEPVRYCVVDASEAGVFPGDEA